MKWDSPAGCLTARCTSISNGRFGHPEQDRALSLREGAILQTFPKNYDFLNPKEIFSMKQTGIHIGNAVPVKLSVIIGKSILKHIEGMKND